MSWWPWYKRKCHWVRISVSETSHYMSVSYDLVACNHDGTRTTCPSEERLTISLVYPAPFPGHKCFVIVRNWNLQLSKNIAEYLFSSMWLWLISNFDLSFYHVPLNLTDHCWSPNHVQNWEQLIRTSSHPYVNIILLLIKFPPFKIAV